MREMCTASSCDAEPPGLSNFLTGYPTQLVRKHKRLRALDQNSQVANPKLYRSALATYLRGLCMGTTVLVLGVIASNGTPFRHYLG